MWDESGGLTWFHGTLDNAVHEFGAMLTRVDLYSQACLELVGGAWRLLHFWCHPGFCASLHIVAASSDEGLSQILWIVWHELIKRVRLQDAHCQVIHH